MTKPRIMSRSRNQIATSYAPEMFFTFEGGLGVCIAKAVPTSEKNLSFPTRNQIFERMQELTRGWYDTASHCRDNDNKHARIMPVQCVDAALLNYEKSDYQEIGSDKLVLLNPSSMGYMPAPLTFVCKACNLVRTYETVKEMEGDVSVLSNPSRCPHPKNPKHECDWRQLDIVFVHWSGRWERPMPHYWDWDRTKRAVVLRRARCSCGSEEMELIRPQSGQIGDWFYRCAQCATRISPIDGWRQQDPDTLEWIGNNLDGGRFAEVRMQPTPHRASNAYFVQTDQFIDFKEGSTARLSMLLPGRTDELADYVGRRYGLGSTMPEESEIRRRVLQSSFASRWGDYEAFGKNISDLERVIAENPTLQGSLQPSIEQNKKARRDLIADLVDRGVIKLPVTLPTELRTNIDSRRTIFASRYDPFRLAVEHQVLVETKLDIDTAGARSPFVNFCSLDDDLSPGEEERKQELERETSGLLHLLGIEAMGLIREFDLCRFSFGYSRMQGTPVLENKHDRNMPVRLNLFPRLKYDGEFRHPVYVVTQGNEAIYIRLKPSVVLAWLASLDCHDMFTLSAGEQIGAGILSAAQPMSRYLDKLPRGTQPNVFFYLYTLLHSYSHLVMRHIAEYSGLDLGSLGEYLFPADLAFVVYRNGTTMDLGNLSAMWRNSNVSLLRSMLHSRAVQCGSGTLCTQRGGACPECMMIPEQTCLAQNKLLSRSVLRNNGGKPKFDERGGLTFRGYLDVAEQAAPNTGV